jgi:hypothetical protein
MDIVPPPEPAPAANDKPDDLAVPPPDDNPAAPDAEADKPASPAPASKPITPKKKSGSGVIAAIVATVIIVLGLAALAVVAYVKTK